jgi:hypothetical protein
MAHQTTKNHRTASRIALLIGASALVGTRALHRRHSIGRRSAIACKVQPKNSLAVISSSLFPETCRALARESPLFDIVNVQNWMTASRSRSAGIPRACSPTVGGDWLRTSTVTGSNPSARTTFMRDETADIAGSKLAMLEVRILPPAPSPHLWLSGRVIQKGAPTFDSH